MALWFELKVNDGPIGYVSAQRMSGGERDDDINNYDVNIVKYGVEGTRATRTNLTVSHRYGDGAFELIRKALNWAWRDTE